MKKRYSCLFLVLVIVLCLLCIVACANYDNASKYTVHTVKFESNGGSEVSDAKSSAITGKVQPPDAPTKDGYIFLYWSELNASHQFDFDTIIAKDIVLYANWQSLTINIVFDGNGNTSGKTNATKVNLGEVVQLPTNGYARIGYDFFGWSTEMNGVASIPDNGYFVGEIGNHEVMILYAVWKPQTFIVNFDLQEGSGNLQSIAATYDSLLPSGLEKPIKEGYIFMGFYSQPNGKGKLYYDESLIPTATYDIAADTTLYAYWESSAVNVEFDGNGSTSGNVESIACNVGDTITLPSNAYSRTGYTFKEWNTSSDGTGESVSSGETHIINSTNTKFYAIWSPISYVIEFKYDSLVPVRQVFVYDQPQALLDNPLSLSGYTILGWSVGKQSNEIDYSAGESVLNLTSQAEEVIEFYAVWQPLTYDIELDKNGGVGGTDRISVIFGETISNIQCPIRAGHIFVGYYSDDNGQGTLFIDSNGNGVSEWNIPDKIKLVAYWMPKTVVLEFMGNGATSGNGSSIISHTDEELSMPECVYKRIGYEFSYWSTNIDGTGDKYYTGDVFKVPVSDQSIIFYAIWTAKKVSLKFDGNGANSGQNEDIQVYSDSFVELPESNFVKIGYSFQGWQTTLDDNSDVIMPNQKFYIEATDNDVTLFAKWEPIKYEITYILDGGQNSQANPSYYTIESETIKLESPTKTGYIFIAWEGTDTILSGSVGDKVFTAEWEVIVYKIEYELFNGINSPNNPDSYTIEDEILLEEPTNRGYEFTGWKEGAFIPRGSTGDKKFTAIWEGAEYTITYDLQGGTNNEENPYSYTIISPDIYLKDPYKKGYKFTGWQPQGMIPTGSVGDITFTATWEIEVYEITYVLSGGTNNPYNPTTYTIESDTFNLLSPNRDGYLFSRWLEGDTVESGTTGDLIFTAEWEIVTYKIFYELEGGINHPDNPEAYNIESDDIIIKDPTRFGYMFKGWLEGSDVIISSGSTGDKFLIASWEAIEYTITYILGADDVQNDNVVSYNIESQVIFNNPVRIGYTFIGWLDMNGEPIVQIPTGSTGDITLTATWEITKFSITYESGLDNVEWTNNNPNEYTIEQQIIFNNPECEGYIFDYWINQEGERVDKIEKGTVGDITLTAQWTLIEYSISYETNIGDIVWSNANPITYTVEQEIVLMPPECEGYIFDCWTNENGERIEKIEKGSIGNIKLIANFKTSTDT